MKRLNRYLTTKHPECLVGLPEDMRDRSSHTRRYVNAGSLACFRREGAEIASPRTLPSGYAACFSINLRKEGCRVGFSSSFFLSLWQGKRVGACAARFSPNNGSTSTARSNPFRKTSFSPALKPAAICLRLQIQIQALGIAADQIPNKVNPLSRIGQNADFNEALRFKSPTLIEITDSNQLQ